MFKKIIGAKNVFFGNKRMIKIILKYLTIKNRKRAMLRPSPSSYLQNGVFFQCSGMNIEPGVLAPVRGVFAPLSGGRLVNIGLTKKNTRANSFYNSALYNSSSMHNCVKINRKGTSLSREHLPGASFSGVYLLKPLFSTNSFLDFKSTHLIHYTSHCGEINCLGISN